MNENRNDEISEILKVERKALWWSVLGGNVLIVLAGQWLLVDRLSGLQVSPADLLRAVSTLLYLGCWTLGTNFDANAQRQVYWNIRSTDGSIGSVYPIVLLLILAGIVLLWANGNERNFALALSLFLIVNVVSWRIFVRIARPIIQVSETTYSRFLPYKLESLAALTTYVSGRWQWYRFAAMLVVILLLDAVCILPEFARHFAVQIGRLNPTWSTDAIAQFLPTSLVITFMTTGEVWGWLMRLRVYAALRRARSNDELAMDEVMGDTPAPEGPVGPREEYKLQNERVVQSFELQLAFPKCLWAAHGAGLLSCAKYLLDHPTGDILQFSGIGLFIYVFTAGFVLAALGYAALMIARNTVLDALWFAVTTKTNSVKAVVKGWLDIVASLALFGVGMVAFAMRVISQ